MSKRKFSIDCGKKSKTRQSFAKDCDINNIMAKYQKTGAISHFTEHQARYDFADSISFHDALNLVKEGDSMFAALPSVLRERFEEPGAFLDFVQDEANGDGRRIVRGPIRELI